MPLKAFLFDLDGTLVSSLPELAGGVNEALVALGREPLAEDAIGAMIGKGLPVLCDKVALAAGLTAEGERDRLWREMLTAMSKSDGARVAVLPGVEEALKNLKRAGYKLALVTNKRRDLTVSFIKTRGWTATFDALVCGDDCARAKPAPDMVLKALEDLKVSREDAVMVGDSRNDAEAAAAAGVRAVLVKGGYNEGCDIDVWAAEAGFDAPKESVAAFASEVLAD